MSPLTDIDHSAILRRLADRYGGSTFAPIDLYDVDHPNLTQREANRQRAIRWYRGLQADGLIRDSAHWLRSNHEDTDRLSELLEAQPTPVIIVAGPTRCSKTRAREALICKLTPIAEFITLPWQTVNRRVRVKERTDNNIDRKPSDPAIIQRIIEEDWDRPDKQVALAIQTASTYMVPARPLYLTGIEIPKRSKIRYQDNLEQALNRATLLYIECSPEMGVAIKQFLLPFAHLVLVIPLDPEASKRPREDSDPYATKWRAKQADYFLTLIDQLTNEGLAHYLFDSLLMVAPYDEFSYWPLEQYKVYVSKLIAEHCHQIYRAQTQKPGWQHQCEGLHRYFDGLPARKARFLNFAKHAGRSNIADPAPDPVVSRIMNHFKPLSNWGLISPQRRSRSDWF